MGAPNRLANAVALLGRLQTFSERLLQHMLIQRQIGDEVLELEDENRQLAQPP